MANSNGSTGGVGINSAAQKKYAPKGLYLALTLLAEGVKDQIPSTTNLVIGGQTVKQAALVSELESDIAFFKAVIDLHNQLASAVAARKAAVPAVKQRYAQIVKAIEGLFAPGDPVLVQFGIHPRKPARRLTAEEKAVRAAKAKLTREARHTLGSKQKLEIQTVGAPTVTITPDGTNIVPQVVGTGTPAGNSQPAATGSGTDANQGGGSNNPSGK